LAVDAGCGGRSLRERLLARLPIHTQKLQIRRWTRSDLGRLAGWPEYPFPYGAFAFSFRGMSAGELDRLFARREVDAARLSLVVDHSDERCVAYVALMRIDWEARRVGDVGVRVHPERCDRGIGSEALRAVLQTAFGAGIDSVSLDVAASNDRAIRCYERVGFETVGEIWRPAPDLVEVDLTLKRFAFVAPHVRHADVAPELRFLVMRSCRAQ